MTLLGCWNHPGNTHKCNQSQCLGRPVKLLSDAYFCCCSGNNCNVEMKYGAYNAEDYETVNGVDRQLIKGEFKGILFNWVLYLHELYFF